jgi:hypothetical protein
VAVVVRGKKIYGVRNVLARSILTRNILALNTVAKKETGSPPEGAWGTSQF